MVVEDDVVEHVFVGVVFFEFVEVFQQQLLILCAFFIPLTIKGEYQGPQLSQLPFTPLEFVDFQFRDLSI